MGAKIINNTGENAKKVVVVGGGLAGTFMAATLCRQDYAVTLIADDDPGSASAIAAGLFNIVTGKYAILTWQAHALMGALHDFFAEAPFDKLAHHINYMPIYWPFRSVFEQNEWAAKSSETDLVGIVQPVFSPQGPGYIKNELGGLFINTCGWVDVPPLLAALKTLLKTNFDLQNEAVLVPYEAIDPLAKTISLTGKTLHYDSIIFAEGPRILENPFFGKLDIRPLKGQLIEVMVQGEELPFVLSRGVYMIPRGSNRYIVGATYERTYEHAKPDSKGLDQLTETLKELISAPFEVISQRAGIRASTPNRKPVVGRHPHHPEMYILNGLGTKGILQAPYFANQLLQYIEGKIDIFDKELALKRLIL